MDTVDKQTRSRIMASVGRRDTDAELILRRALHRIGLRYRHHDRSLPGSPDLVFRRYKAVIFVHGCYWHSHGCYRSTVPKSGTEFWNAKFEANRRRDLRNVDALLDRGWRVLIIWECALKGKLAHDPSAAGKAVKRWLKSNERRGNLAGTRRESKVRLCRIE